MTDDKKIFLVKTETSTEEDIKNTLPNVELTPEELSNAKKDWSTAKEQLRDIWRKQACTQFEGGQKFERQKIIKKIKKEIEKLKAKEEETFKEFINVWFCDLEALLKKLESIL